MTDSAIFTKSDHYHLLNIFSKSDSRGGSGSPPGSRECSQGCCRTGFYILVLMLMIMMSIRMVAVVRTAAGQVFTLFLGLDHRDDYDEN